MIKRSKQNQYITDSLGRRSILWLAGVRRVGKTTICKIIPEAKYFDCELPSVREQLSDPEFFWNQHVDNVVVLDEIHRLIDPSEVLKIAADHYPSVKVVATGSSTLGAKNKFKDTLTGRKHMLWIQPLGLDELRQSDHADLHKRLLHGGLPQAYLSEAVDDYFYSEWMDSFWAKDVQELFVVDKKSSFLKLAELILRQSGELFNASSFAAPCEVSRQTIQNYLQILETSLFVHILRPLPTNRDNDLISAPKVFGFDTGFVCFSRGWSQIRSDDFGTLLEHLILEEIKSIPTPIGVFYWRDKQKHEVDFIIKKSRGEELIAIECKTNMNSFDAKNLKIFRRHNPKGKNILVAANVTENHVRQVAGLSVEFINPWYFKERIESLI